MDTSRILGAYRAVNEFAGADILDALDIPIVLLGLDCNVVRFNRAAGAILRLGTDHIGGSPHDIAVFAAMPDLEQRCARVISDGTPYRSEVSHDGRWFLIRIAPYARDGGQVEGTVLTLTNVTAFRASIDQSVYEREYTKMILNTVIEPLVVLDQNLRVQTANRAFYTMFRVSRDEAQGISLTDLRNHVWDDPALWRRLREACFDGTEIPTVEIEHDFPKIGRRTLLLDARPLSWEAHPGRLLLLAFRDISERKQVEKHLREAMAELQNRAAQVAEATDALRESDQKKDQFLAVLAHELRNPLAPVRYAAQYLRTNELPDHFKRPVEMIDRQMTHMARLIDDLLDVSRISRGMLELRRETLDFREIATAAMDSFQEEVAENRHILTVDLPNEPLPLHADRHRLIQVFSNIVSNALKYSPVEGRVELSARRNGDVLEARITDTGIGIPPEKLSVIFGLFEQVDRSLERQSGLGIGLALSRDLVQLHGGTIEAHSPGLGHGSTFVVTLPIAIAPASTTTVDTAPEAHVRPYRILVADDNKDAADSLAMLLEFAGHTVRLAGDGAAALDIAGSFLPEVAFLDIGMPRMNGYDAARRIRENEWGKTIHLIALTGWGQDKDRQLAQAAGFDAHLVKPVSPDAINRLLLQLREDTE